MVSWRGDQPGVERARSSFGHRRNFIQPSGPTVCTGHDTSDILGGGLTCSVPILVMREAANLVSATLRGGLSVPILVIREAANLVSATLNIHCA